MIIKAKVKDVFKSKGVQLPDTTYNLLNDEIARKIRFWAQRAKEGNIKRLNPEDVWMVIGNPWKKVID
tara:strand:- start:211 stop:414 length:204 start_codon:yes stop_codon:yes gene_type:complete